MENIKNILINLNYEEIINNSKLKNILSKKK